MGRKRIPMKKIRKILKLKYDANLSIREIARALDISKTIVGEYLGQFNASELTFEKAMSISDDDLVNHLQNHKEETSEKYKSLLAEIPEIVKSLKSKGMTRQLAWQEYIEKYPEGYGYSRFCHHLKLFEEQMDVSMHHNHEPGDMMYIDYAGSKPYYLDRKTEEKIYVEFFVAVLGASSKTYAEASPSQKQDYFIRSTENAFRFFGGATKAIVPDNLKSAVTKADKYDPVINPVFDDFSEYYRTTIIPARAYKPKDKPLAENAVNIMYQRIYAPLRNKTFYSLEELNEAIWIQLEKHNNKPLQVLGISRNALFEEIEKSTLKTLPSEPYPIKYYEERTVQPNYHIILSADKHYYSVPWELKGERVRVIYDERNVAVYHNNVRIVQHRRHKQKGTYTTLDAHMPKNHQFFASWSEEKFLSWANNIGSETERVITHLLNSKRHPQQAFKTCVGILSLAKKYSNEELNLACRKAWNWNRMTSRDVKGYIESIREQRKITESDETMTTFISHENLREKSQYQ